MKRLLFLPLIFLVMTAYAGTPLYSTKVDRSLSDMLDSAGKWKRILVSPGSEAQVRSDLGAAESGTNTSITSLAAHESGTITMNGNIKLNGKFLSGDGGNEGIYVDGNGDVGIGTTNPDKVGWEGSVLTIESAGAQNTIEFVNTSNTMTTNTGIGFIHFMAGSAFNQIAGINAEVVGTNENSGRLYSSSMDNGVSMYFGFFVFPSGNFAVSPNATGTRPTDNGAQLQVTGSATVSGNLGIGGATNFGTGTGMLVIANGTVTGMSAISNQGEIFCEGGELKVMDGSGNITTFSPHSDLDNLVTNLADPLPHTYVSTNSYLGKKKIINMAALVEEIEKLSGKTLTTYEDVPLRDWTTDQDDFRVQRDLDRLRLEAEIDEINIQIAEVDNQLSVAEEEKKEGLERNRKDLQKQKGEQNKTMPEEYILQHPPKWMQDRGVTLDL